MESSITVQVPFRDHYLTLSQKEALQLARHLSEWYTQSQACKIALCNSCTYTLCACSCHLDTTSKSVKGGY